MGPEIWVGIAAVFVAGGAIGSAGTLLAQWLLRKLDSDAPGSLTRGDGDRLRAEVRELKRRMRNVDARLDFTEQLIGGALPLNPAPERLEESDVESEELDQEGADKGA